MIKVLASLLAADFLHMEREIVRMRDAGADYLHFDVMDGRFVPNISFGLPLLEAASRLSALPCDVHLMIESPETYIERFARAGARAITVHAEATNHLDRALSEIRRCGCLAGVALNPASPPEMIRYAMGAFDHVLVMTVNPGFGGQKLIPSAVQKIGDIRKMLDAAGVRAEIQVDGGVNLQTAAALVRQGATMLVAGSALYGAQDPGAFIERIKRLEQ